MSDGKLRLNLAALRLKSFDTTPDVKAERGTVLGMVCEPCSQCTGCTNCTAATYGCSQITYCGYGTGPVCPGASATDSYGPYTQYCEPETWYCSEWQGCPETYGCTWNC
jgi:hypothetical protein